MKKFLLASATLLAFGAPAMGEPYNGVNHATPGNAYVSGAVGWSIGNDDEFRDDDLPGNGGDVEKDGAIPFSLAIGKNIMPEVRVELEGSYRKADVSNFGIDGDLATWTAMVNAFYDIPVDLLFTPYLVGGIGAAIHDGDFSGPGGYDANEVDLRLAWKLGGGVNYALNDQMELFGGYQYLATNDARIESTKVDYSAHEVLGGLRYRFR